MRRFAVRDNLGGGAGDYGLALATFGVGGAVGALAISSRRLPRRYLGAMLLLWGLGALPLADIGLAGALWAMGVVLFAVGAAISAQEQHRYHRRQQEDTDPSHPSLSLAHGRARGLHRALIT